MGKFRDFAEESRDTCWGTHDPGQITESQIALGAVLRIADAVEAMASSYADLERDRDYWRGMYERRNKAVDRVNLSLSAMRGVATKLKKRLTDERRVGYAEGFEDGR